MSRIRLAVIFGGRSTEHSISCVSAGSVLRAVDREKYDVVPIGIAPDGRWVLAADDPAALEAHGRELPSVDAATGAAVALAGDPSVKGLLVLEPGDVPRALTSVDVVFPLLHGPYGEDGTVQGLLELAGVPYVGSGVLASAVCMDKEFMKVLLAARGLPVGPYAVLRRGDDAAAATAHLVYPLFVKPARGGSSLGISKVTSPDGLAAALETAWANDPKAVVEQMVPGRELECAVLQGRGGAAPETSLPAEVLVAGDWYDFDAKYLDEATEFAVPADLPDDVTARVRDLAARAFTATGCAGLARVDFFLTGDELVVNEVNTMPGFTPQSMYPRMWAATGVGYPELVDRLVTLALESGTGLR
ncbi:MAG TPA: D-alanine--D-alanine ligase family protein [Mycobacteriales bacterium]|nr:D-alanine--D-alanine ligase family protein [Mycobacteriales bacterium]